MTRFAGTVTLPTRSRGDRRRVLAEDKRYEADGKGESKSKP